MEQVLDRPQPTVQAVHDEARLSYYTSQPAPTQWIAVGVLTSASVEAAEPRRRLVVGTGTNESAAVAALQRRVTGDHRR